MSYKYLYYLRKIGLHQLRQCPCKNVLPFFRRIDNITYFLSMSIFLLGHKVVIDWFC